MNRLLFLSLCFLLTGCELFNLVPRNKVSRTDVASVRKGAPSAEVLISFFSGILRDEAEGKPPAWGGTYEDYWKSRMEYIAKEETSAYYNRVFRDFGQARAKLGLAPIDVPPYETLSGKSP